jgi:hypothetical protein
VSRRNQYNRKVSAEGSRSLCGLLHRNAQRTQNPKYIEDCEIEREIIAIGFGSYFQEE